MLFFVSNLEIKSLLPNFLLKKMIIFNKVILKV